MCDQVTKITMYSFGSAHLACTGVYVAIDIASIATIYTVIFEGMNLMDFMVSSHSAKY